MRPTLRHLCFPAASSIGRRHPEPPHPHRSAFQRDRDRVIHTRAFRRLVGKTQVFAPGLSSHFRNRLTHTIEVAQIARTVARALDLQEDLTEALALVHDVGHPPFAHAGEEELNRQMAAFGDRFDHNLHALRLVETFEDRYARFPGLNLTFEVREGIVKHSRDLLPGEFPDLDEYLPGVRPPLEAQLIDLADEAAYNTADLDDAFSARLFTVSEVCACVPMFARLYSRVESEFPSAPDKIRFLETLRGVVDHIVTGLIEGTHAAAGEAGVQDSEAVRRHPTRLAAFTAASADTNRQLKRFLRERVYVSDPLVTERRRSAAQVSELFSLYLRHPERLPARYQSQARREPLHRVVCDYIAGMTDAYFRRIFTAATQPDPLPS